MTWGSCNLPLARIPPKGGVTLVQVEALGTYDAVKPPQLKTRWPW
jgi:hypothetical protein